MKILVIVISTRSEYQSQRDAWLENIKYSKPLGVDIYFVESSNEIQVCQLNDYTLSVPGNESIKSIILKSVEALRYFLVEGHEYSYILRTNMSSLWIFKNYLTFISTLPSEKVYCGIVGTNNKLNFVSGAGITFTPDVCKLLIESKKDLSLYSWVDDLGIAKFLLEHNIPAANLGASRTDLHLFSMCEKVIASDFQYHFRCKQPANRDNEGQCMKLLLRKYTIVQ